MLVLNCFRGLDGKKMETSGVKWSLATHSRFVVVNVPLTGCRKSGRCSRVAS